MSSTVMSSTFTTSISTSQTSSIVGQITNPAFFGYESLSFVGSSVAYSSKDCQSASTFTTSDTFAACCSGPCTPFTGCLASSTLIGPSRTSICSPSLTCKSDVVYATEGAAGSLALYCGQGPGHTWYRGLPSNGIDASISSPTSTPASGMSLGGPVGGALGGLFFLVVVGVLICVCGCCGLGGRSGRGGGGGGGGSSGSNYPSYADQEYERRQQEQIRMGYEQDQRERDRLAS